MLRRLTVSDLAVIASLSVDFAPGLNVITGETGAGKSVLVQALGLLLGDRASTDQVRTGCSSAVIEGVFDVRGHGAVEALLAAEGLVAADTLILRRTVPARGSGRSSCNGQAVPVAFLRRLGQHTLDFSGQHEHRVLLDPTNHLGVLDRYAATGLRGQVSRAHEGLLAASARVAELEQLERQAEQRAAFLRFQLAELTTLDPRAGERPLLQAERSRLAHGERLAAGTGATLIALTGDDNAAATLLQRALGHLSDLGRIDPAFDAVATQIEEARILIDEAASDVQRLGGDGRDDPGRQRLVEDRLATWDRLARVHGVEADELPARALALQDELDELESLDLSLDEARRAREGVAAGALEVALAERTARLAAALRVEGAVAGELSGLAMPAARFGVVLHPVDQGERLPGGERLGAGGLDRAAFLLSANPGEDPRPLATVASGGELSRVLLALKCVLHGDDAPGSGAHVGTFVFDEVDTGIGGDTAERVGFRLADLALRRQLLVITHLPQIAAMAATWFSVDKVVAEGRTFSQVQVLDRPAREVELARMVGGVLDPAARRWARAVLDRHETLPT